MGTEFRATYDAQKVAIPAFRLARELQKLGAYQIQAINDRELSLRFPEAPRRTSWPEDASIYFDDEGVSVVIHSGTVMQTTSLIDHITKVYRDLDIPVSFGEE